MTPFEIDPNQIEQLRSAFGVFISNLLAAEQAAYGIRGHHLTFNRNETTPDGGVDAALMGAVETDWLPLGDSAWQFKLGNLGPAKCAGEIEKATWAHEYLRRGGHYVMVLGQQLTDKAIRDREKALQDVAVARGVIAEADRARLRVYDANQLARWASQYPALTLYPPLRVPLRQMQSYERWSASQTHQDTWVPEAHRTEIIRRLVAALKSSDGYQFRVEGPSGIGKTRLIMEALKDDELRALVAYGPDATQITPEIINYLADGQRTAILVIDECDRRVHDKLAEQIPIGANLRLMTIGQSDGRSLSVPLVTPRPMPPADIETVLKTNRPDLWPEARRFVSENCAGNVRMAYVLAAGLKEKGAGQAAELMQRGDIQSILNIVLPTDGDFFFMTALALFDRVGWEGELEAELRIVAEFSNTTVTNLKRVGVWLEEHGLLESQGRYRAIVPNPVAVYLAAKAWDMEGQRIINELLSKLSPQMLTALFMRVADLGRYAPASSVLEELLAPEGLFGTLEDIERRGVGDLLEQLAIVIPERTVAHIGRLIEGTSVDDLLQLRSIRRSLVGALEKLAWHTATFWPAAHALLRLALAENESYANNATGTWASLFGMVLPTTAALPDQRLAHLRDVAQDDDPRVRVLVVAACEAGLSSHETAVVSPELQQGTVVEPRGSVKTYQEAATYGAQLVALLSQLADDRDESVAHAAFKALSERLHPEFLNGPYGAQLRTALVLLGSRFNRELRAEMARARGWASRTDDVAFVEALDSLLQNLPDLTPMDQLRALAAVGPWQFGEASLKTAMDNAVAQALEHEGLAAIVNWLSTEDVPAASVVGDALAVVTNAQLGIRDALAQTTMDPTALAGFLRASVTMGYEDAFDVFVDSDLGNELDKETQLFLTMRGPASPRAKARATELALELAPRKAAPALIGWGHELAAVQVAILLPRWLTVEDQADYDAVIDWLAFWAHGREALPQSVKGLMWELLMRRKDLAIKGHTTWDWCELAQYFVPSHAASLVELLLELAVNRGVRLANSEETRLVMQCITQDPSGVWSVAAPYLDKQDWRLEMDLQGWFVQAVPVDIVTDWIGHSVERARTVAHITDPGDAAPTALGRFLLSHFPGDSVIAASLSAQYAADGWSGSWSSHLKEQIEQLEGWIRGEGASSPVGKWAQTEINHLRLELRRATQEEAERR